MRSEVGARFERVWRDAPDKIVLRAPALGRTLTTGELWQSTHDTARALTRAGLSLDHLIVSAAGNHPGFYPLLLACLETRIAVLPVDRGTPMAQIEELADRFGASAIVTPAAPDLARPSRLERLPCDLVLADLADQRPDPALYAGAAVLKLTSGSTGLPKATFTTEGNLCADALQIIEAMDIRPDDNQLGIIPLSHAYGMGNLLMPVLLQGTSVTLRETFIPPLVVEDANAQRARVFPGVPFMFEHLLEHLAPDCWPASLDTLISAGAPLDPDLARAFAARFGVKIHSFYGTTETGGIAFDDSDDPDVASVVGRPLPGVAVTLRREEGAAPPAGRVHVRSAAVARGYAGSCNAEADGFEDGGFLTGDVGMFDDAGRLMLVGRVSSFINVAGRKVRPYEVEAVLRRMPGIADARVVGAPDERRGEQLVACLVVNRALRPFEIRQFCATRLAAHQIPREFIFLDELPRDARGKTSRRALDSLVEGHLANRNR
jgi:acyl-CoA synthetase (AMP-forming)/AMP-acid ligase II